MFNNHQYALIVRLALARKQAAEKGLAPALTEKGKQTLAESYAALHQWKEALALYDTLPDIPQQVKNECRSHLSVPLQSEKLPESAWTNKTDFERVVLAYECIDRKDWDSAIAILNSMGHRVVRMNYGGPWAPVFAPVFPAVAADQVRQKAGKASVNDPLRFEIGDVPYVACLQDGYIRDYTFEVEGENIWVAAINEIKRYSGPGPFAANKASEVHSFRRTSYDPITCTAVNADFVWAGTVNDGLLRLDRKTGECKRLTMDDGLLVNGISSLCVAENILWIGYTNGQNGTVGTYDLRTQKYSAFTPKLSTAAGTNSQSSYYQSRLDLTNQPPQLPIACMVAGAPGEMWFGVNGKGLQRFRSSDSSWATIWPTRIDNDHMLALAFDAARGQILAATQREDHHSYGESWNGGLRICDSGQNHHEDFNVDQGLPSDDVTAVAADGRIAWIGGRGFVGVLDLDKRKLLRVAYISAARIFKIQLDKKYAWIQVATKAGPSDPVHAGTARPGVYRVERSTVEPSGFAVSKL